MIRRLTILLLLMPALAAPTWGAPLDIVPFQTANRSPLVQIFGLPAPGTSRLLAPGASAVAFAVDTAQNFADSRSGNEAVLLDGESYRFNLNLRRGLTPRFEAGIDLPYLAHRGGSLDGFIEDWHDTFGLPQNGRDQAPHDRLLYSYVRDGKQEILVDDNAQGIGDLRLNAAWQITNRADGNPWDMALHAALKLPTGDSDDLLGSGSTDLALWLAGSRSWPLDGAAITLFGSLGALGLTDGDVVEDRQKNLVGFATLGGGWRPLDWLVLKLQVDGHTPFFDSALDELGEPAAILTFGGDLALGAETALEIGISEDIATETAPDIVFRLALRSRF